MKRLTAAGMMIIGTLVMGAEVHNQATMFSSERIWDRQRPMIERTLRRHPAAKQARFEELRSNLARLEKGTSRERCVFETDFRALLETRGDQEEADRLIARRSFVPYAHCDASEQFKRGATKWYGLVSIGAFLLGLGSLVASFVRRRRERNAAEQPTD
jgi:hypothetical protein